MPIGRYWKRVVSGIRRFPETGRLRCLERDLADAQAALIVGDVVEAQTALLRARAELVELRQSVRRKNCEWIAGWPTMRP